MLEKLSLECSDFLADLATQTEAKIEKQQAKLSAIDSILLERGFIRVEPEDFICEECSAEVSDKDLVYSDEFLNSIISNIPKHHQWLATDSDGEVYTYEVKPTLSRGGNVWATGDTTDTSFHKKIILNKPAALTLRQIKVLDENSMIVAPITDYEVL